MKYRFWILQDPPPVGTPEAADLAPRSDDPVPHKLRYPGLEVEGVLPAADEILRVFEFHGITDPVKVAVIRGKVAESFSQGFSFRAKLPTPGRWLLGEPVKGS